MFQKITAYQTYIFYSNKLYIPWFNQVLNFIISMTSGQLNAQGPHLVRCGEGKDNCM